MGLLEADGSASEKLEEIINFTEQNNLHVLGITEAALHWAKSRVRRQFPATLPSLKYHLRVPGYTLLLPDTWEKHSQARLVVFVKESLNYKVVRLDQFLRDLPLLTMEVWKGGQQHTLVSYFYREYTGGVSGWSSLGSLRESLT